MGTSLVGSEPTFKEHEQIVLTVAVCGDRHEQLQPGDVGTIVHIHQDTPAYVVEFEALDDQTVAIATVLPSQARPVTSA